MYYINIQVTVKFIQSITLRALRALRALCLLKGLFKKLKVGCMYAATFGSMYAAFGCMSMERLGACMSPGPGSGSPPPNGMGGGPEGEEPSPPRPGVTKTKDQQAGQPRPSKQPA